MTCQCYALWREIDKTFGSMSKHNRQNESLKYDCCTAIQLGKANAEKHEENEDSEEKTNKILDIGYKSSSTSFTNCFSLCTLRLRKVPKREVTLLILSFI